MKKRVVSLILVCVLLVCAFSATGCALLLKTDVNTDHDTGEQKSPQTQGKDEKDEIRIVPSEASTVSYETYDNGLVSFEIPKGWKVDIPMVDYIHYSFKAYDPDKPERMFFFFLKLEGFEKSWTARSLYASLYPDAPFSKLPAIEPNTTEGFYAVWNDTAEYCNTVNLKTNYMPKMNDFSVIENLGSLVLGGDILRASFKSESGVSMQGLFTCTVSDPGPYYLRGVDVWPLNVYHTVAMMAPDEEFNDWQGILDHCLGTMAFSQTFVNGFMNQEATLVSTIQANQKVYNSISDMIMDSWEKRNASYDIISQKQSDATLGYERVYDTETGDVYRAYNGFTDTYSGERFQPVTDDMYTSPISGYIEK